MTIRTLGRPKTKRGAPRLSRIRALDQLPIGHETERNFGSIQSDSIILDLCLNKPRSINWPSGIITVRVHWNLSSASPPQLSPLLVLQIQIHYLRESPPLVSQFRPSCGEHNGHWRRAPCCARPWKSGPWRASLADSHARGEARRARCDASHHAGSCDLRPPKRPKCKGGVPSCSSRPKRPSPTSRAGRRSSALALASAVSQVR